MIIAYSFIDSTRVASVAFLLFFLSVSSSVCLAADSPPLFSNDWLIGVTLEAPFEKIMRERDESQEPEGAFVYRTADGLQQSLDVKVRVRGRFRARKRICDFAPLRLNFKKKQVANTEFDRQDKLKLVTHCENTGKQREQLVLKEYLSYQFLTLFTEYSFRTRLLRITYVDSDHTRESRTKYAFLIEEKEHLARRIGATLARLEPVQFDQLNHIQTNLTTVFSYFIGNTDYSAIRGTNTGLCCHNIVLFEKQPGIFFPIPYDFDFSGMVNAPYAAPNPRLDIDSVTTRLYRGICRNNALLNQTLQRFHEHRGEIYALIIDLTGLSTKSQREMTRFVDDFYEIVSDEKRVNRHFVKKCSGASAPPNPTLATPQ